MVPEQSMEIAGMKKFAPQGLTPWVWDASRDTLYNEHKNIQTKTHNKVAKNTFF